MSRVYEALRQSELDRGVAPALLDPDSFLSASLSPAPPTTLPEMDSLAWDKIASFQPLAREDSRLVAFTDDNSLGAEKFRLLRARLRHMREQQQLARIVLTSAVPNEGKTMVSMNLAISLSKHSTEKVLLLEGDLRKPMLAEHFGISGARGLDDWFAGTEPISSFVYQFQDSSLYVLPAGVPRDNPLAILQSPRFGKLYRQLSKDFPWILIDAPPLLPMADVNFWSRQADGLLLVVREGRTPKKILQKGLETLDNPRLIGVVVNDARGVESAYYQDYYGGLKGPARKSD